MLWSQRDTRRTTLKLLVMLGTSVDEQGVLVWMGMANILMQLKFCLAERSKFTFVGWIKLGGTTRFKIMTEVP